MLSLKDFKEFKGDTSRITGGASTPGGEFCAADGSCKSYSSDTTVTFLGFTSTAYHGVKTIDKACE